MAPAVTSSRTKARLRPFAAQLAEKRTMGIQERTGHVIENTGSGIFRTCKMSLRLANSAGQMEGLRRRISWMTKIVKDSRGSGSVWLL